VITELAQRQHGVVVGAQVVELGVTRRMLQTRVASGRLTRIGPDLYLVGGAPLTWEGKLLGLVLAAGDGAVASHRAAAALWGLDGFTKGTPELTTPRGKRFRRRGARVHESTDLDRCGVRTRARIPVTDPSRTILDLARRTSDVRLAQAIESARRLQLTSWRELIATLRRHARCGRPGIRRLRRVIASGMHREEVTDSDFELLVLALIAEHGLPEPVLHHAVVDASGRHLAEVDLAYPELRIAIELDGGAHQRRDVFERDRPRQNRLVLEGWIVLRFTWDAFRDRPEEIVAAIRAARQMALVA
jgi:hypothetical protein